MTTTTDEQLINGVQGRWLGTRGIFRHHGAAPEDVDLNGEEGVYHVMSTSVGGDVTGELIRWGKDGEIGYEVRINGSEEHGGICDIAAYTIDDLSALAKVANDLRYEWEQITGLHGGVTWSVL